MIYLEWDKSNCQPCRHKCYETNNFLPTTRCFDWKCLVNSFLMLLEYFWVFLVHTIPQGYCTFYFFFSTDSTSWNCFASRLCFRTTRDIVGEELFFRPIQIKWYTSGFNTIFTQATQTYHFGGFHPHCQYVAFYADYYLENLSDTPNRSGSMWSI